MSSRFRSVCSFRCSNPRSSRSTSLDTSQVALYHGRGAVNLVASYRTVPTQQPSQQTKDSEMNSRILSLRSGARLAASTQIVVNNNNNRSKIILRCKSSRPDPKSLFDTANKTANEFFVALRWKAANALTASMPEDEREKLLEKFQPKLAETDSEVVAASTIAEAVAAALGTVGSETDH